MIHSRRFILLLILFSVFNLGFAVRDLQTPCTGSIDRYEIYSQQMKTTLLVDVWLPDDYEIQTGNSYPVIYMHDGQNAFDSNGSFAGVAWDIDDTLTRLHNEGLTENAVVVGIHCTANRFGDYSPSKALAVVPGLTAKMQNVFGGQKIKGDEYLEFIVNTLKPMIEEKYRVRTDLRSTSIMGSSMGGLISVYAISEYPEVFGNAACLSTHWIGSLDNTTPEFAEAIIAYLDENIPADGDHRIYFDHGTKDLDAYYPEWNQRVVDMAKAKGMIEGYTLMNYIATGASHNEYFWSRRLGRPLEFILGPMLLPLDEEGASYHLPNNISDGNILHCFDWKLKDITADLPYIAVAGFKAVQTSPMQRAVPAGDIWYDVYRPADYKFIDNGMGTRDDMRRLCSEANRLGISVIVDIVANHGTGPDEDHDPWWDLNDRMKYGATIDYSNRWSETHDCLGGYGESASDDPDVQQRTRNYILELKGLGVGGLRWDAAKHIGLPSEGCDFWKNVLTVPGIWSYGEILGAPAQDRSKMKEYAEMMCFTNTSGVPYGYNAWSDLGINSDRLVNWVESHDTFSNPPYSSQSISQNEVDRRWAIIAAREGSRGLYFSRPPFGEGGNIKVGRKGSTLYRNSTVAAANHFHNAMINQPEKYYESNGIRVVYRHNGLVVTKEGGGQVELPIGNLDPDGIYDDEITGASFEIRNDKVYGEIDATAGVAVVYDYSTVPSPVIPPTPVTPDEPVYVYLHFDDSDYGNYSWYVFVYDSGISNSGWPGEIMIPDDSLLINGFSGGWLRYEVPEEFSENGLAMVSSSKTSYRYPAHNEPGIPLEGESLIFFHHDGVWSTSRVSSDSGVEAVDIPTLPLGFAVEGGIATTRPGVEIFTPAGIRKALSGSVGTISLPAGIYILRCGSQVMKLAVTR